jgi:hypothetical protein
LATHFIQQIEEPVIEPADFDHSDVTAIVLRLLAEFSQELANLIGSRAHLSLPHDVPRFVSQTNRDLSGMLITSKVKHCLILLVLGFVTSQHGKTFLRFGEDQFFSIPIALSGYLGRQGRNQMRAFARLPNPLPMVAGIALR